MPVRMSYQPPRIFLAGIHLAEGCKRHWEGPRVRMTGQRYPGTNLFTIKPKTAEVLLGSLTLLLSALAPLPNSLLLCQHMCLLGKLISKC